MRFFLLLFVLLYTIDAQQEQLHKKRLTSEQAKCYLARNPDLGSLSLKEGIKHYKRHGHKEGRSIECQDKDTAIAHAVMKFDSPKVREFTGAAVMLVQKDWTVKRKDSRKCFFNTSMDALQQYWKPQNSYPLVLCHEGWLPEDMQNIRNRWPLLDIEFLNVESVFRKHSGDAVIAEGDRLHTLNYRKMCEFWTNGFLNIPGLKKYRYIFRLDDDTCLLNRVPIDVFDLMYRKKASYAFKMILRDHPHYVEGLNEFGANYLSSMKKNYSNEALTNWVGKQSLVSHSPFGSAPLAPQQPVWCFSTNLEFIDTTRFRKEDISDFNAKILMSKKIYTTRWGDAPLRYNVLSMRCHSLTHTLTHSYTHTLTHS